MKGEVNFENFMGIWIWVRNDFRGFHSLGDPEVGNVRIVFILY